MASVEKKETKDLAIEKTAMALEKIGQTKILAKEFVELPIVQGRVVRTVCDIFLEPRLFYQIQGRVGMYAEGYHRINRFKGVQIWEPPTVPGPSGIPIPNPQFDHQIGFYRVTSRGIWFSDSGIPQAAQSTITFSLAQYREYLRSKKAKKIEYILDPQGKKLYDSENNPLFRLILSEDDELEVHRSMMELRNFAERRVLTIAHKRILMVATGLNNFSQDVAKTGMVYQCVVYRTMMTIQDQIKLAQEVDLQIQVEATPEVTLDMMKEVEEAPQELPNGTPYEERQFHRVVHTPLFEKEEEERESFGLTDPDAEERGEPREAI